MPYEGIVRSWFGDILGLERGRDGRRKIDVLNFYCNWNWGWYICFHRTILGKHTTEAYCGIFPAGHLEGAVQTRQWLNLYIGVSWVCYSLLLEDIILKLMLFGLNTTPISLNSLYLIYWRWHVVRTHVLFCGSFLFKVFSWSISSIYSAIWKPQSVSCSKYPMIFCSIVQREVIY